MQDLSQEDIEVLRQGKDPRYDSYLSPHVYFMVYFLEGVYSAYLAWFLVYKSGFLPSKSNILDIGAGSGAMLYGMNSFLKSIVEFSYLPQRFAGVSSGDSRAQAQIQISYCSLELRSSLQHHGLEFWKQYIEAQQTTVVNTYFRFNTMDLFTYCSNSSGSRNLPDNFFDFIVISHCIFADKTQRARCHQAFKKIFSDSLKDNGFVIVVVQGRRLFQAYGRYQSENQAQEERLIKEFTDEIGLQMEWYKYLTSTGQRKPMGQNFARIAREKDLPIRNHMNELIYNYLNKKHEYYVLDDYVILAKK